MKRKILWLFFLMFLLVGCNQATTDVLVTTEGEIGLIELRVFNDKIQWKYELDDTWTDLVALSTLTGPAGEDGKAVLFRVNEDIIQNKFDENTWNAFYEGKIEPFGLQLGLVLTNMTFTENEIAHGNQIMLTSNRLQYASNQTKLQVSTQLFDRGVLTTNQIMDIWNLPHVEGGDERYIRKEYGKVGEEDGNGEESGAGIPKPGDDEPEPSRKAN